MSNYTSGEFVLYDTQDTTAAPAIGLVLRTASNHLADGSTDDFVELIGPLPMVLVKEENVHKFNAEPEPDPTEVMDSTSSEAKGVKKTSNAKDVPTGPKPA